MTGYLWFKALHVFCVLIWIAGMYRLAVASDVESLGEEELKSTLAFARKWTSPAMIVAWAVGLYLAARAGWFMHHWFQVKFTLALTVAAGHGIMLGRLKAKRTLRRAPLYLTLMLAVIVVMVIVRPF